MAIALDTLAYAKRLREVGFSEEQAEGQAQALAAAMSDTFASKQDLRELEARIESRFVQVDARFEYLERHFDTRLAELEKRVETRLVELDKRMEVRLAEQAVRFDARMLDMERRLTVRMGGMMVASVGVLSALMKLL